MANKKKPQGSLFFGHFSESGERYDTIRADYMTESNGCALLWLNGAGRAESDELIAVIGLASGASNLRLLTDSQLPKKK